MDMKELINKADDAYYAAFFDQAIQLYKQVLELDSDNEHAQEQLEKAEKLQRANNAYYADEYSRAIRLFKEFLDLEPDNQYAREQLEKVEKRQIPGKPILNLPREAVQLFRRSRSFISAGDIAQASELLNRAINIANEAGIDFQEAKMLLMNLDNAQKAEEIKKLAYKELDTQQWIKALDHLNSTLDFDPTDDTVRMLVDHLQSLLKARKLVEEIDAKIVGIVGRYKYTNEIRKIIDLTKETTALSTLWQNVVVKFGEVDRSSRFRIRTSLVIFLVVFSGLFGGLSAAINWSPGAFIALGLLLVAFIILIYSLSNR